MGRKYGKVLTIILIIIIISVIALLAYLGYDYFSKYNTEKDAENAVDTFISTATETPTATNEDNLNNSTEIASNNLLNNTNTTNTTNSRSATKPKYKGFNMIGTIEIPKTGAKYPVLERVTKKSLETAVAVIYPFENPVLNTEGNVVIQGHNYRNGQFFSDNKKLSKGDRIYITDLNKKKVTYTVYKVFQTSESDTSFYNRDTDGKMEITLSTCTDDSSARIIVEARAD